MTETTIIHTEADQVARDIANSAMNAIETHEKVCAERQLHIIETLRELKDGVAGLYRRFWVAAIFVISTLFSVCGGLIYLILSKPH